MIYMDRRGILRSVVLWAARPIFFAFGTLARERNVKPVENNQVERRVREVSQYIDPATTTPFALAVIPDAAYDVCRSAIVSAHHRHVMVVGYAMALPYLLTLYQLHLQFARTVDMEKLQAALIDIERQVDVLEGILENRVQRTLTVLQNAYTEGRQAAAKIRASAQGAQVPSSPAGEGGPTRGARPEGRIGVWYTRRSYPSAPHS